MPPKIKWFLARAQKGKVEFDRDSMARKRYGIKEIGVKFAFTGKKLRVRARARPPTCKVKRVLIYDLSEHVSTGKPPEGEKLDEIILKTEPYGVRIKRKPSMKTFVFPIREDFGGRGLGIVIQVRSPRGWYWYPFFASGTFIPTLHIVVTLGATLSIIRYGGEFRLLEDTFTVRLPNGKFVEVGDAVNAKVLSKEDLEHIAMLAPFSLFTTRIKGRVKVGEEFLKEIFDEIASKDMMSAVMKFDGFYLALYSTYWKGCDFLLPDPRWSFMEAKRHYEIMDNAESLPEWVTGFCGMLGYSALTVLDLITMGKVVKKIRHAPKFFDKILEAAKRSRKNVLSRLEKLKKANPKHEKKITRAIEDIEKNWGSPPRTRRLPRRARPRVKGGKVKGKFRRAKVKKPEVKGKVEKSWEKIRKKFAELPVDTLLRLFRTAKLIQYMRRVIKAKNLKNFLKLTKKLRVDALTRGKLFINWMKIQLMRSKRLLKLKFSKKVDDLVVKKGKAFDDRWYFPDDDFKPIVKGILRGLKKVGAKGLNKTDVKHFREAMSKAYQRLLKKEPKLARQYVNGIEFSGKSATGIDGSVSKLNDIDGTILPIPKAKEVRAGKRIIEKAGALDEIKAKEVRKTFFNYMDEEFEKLNGSHLKDKNIWIYDEFGEGALNKVDEGWPKELRSIYDKVETKRALTFDESGGLSLLPIENAAIASGKMTPEEAEKFCRKALEAFLKTENPKWIHKADRVLEAAYGAERKAAKFSAGDNDIAKKAREMMFGSDETFDVDRAKDFLRKYGGDTDVAIMDERYIFLLESKTEAEEAVKFVNKEMAGLRKEGRYFVDTSPKTAPSKESIVILYKEKGVITPDGPEQETIELLEEISLRTD